MMNDMPTSREQDLNRYATRIYDAKGRQPRKVDDDFTLNMANDAIRELKFQNLSIEASKDLYKDDKEKCNKLLEDLGAIDQIGNGLSEEISDAKFTIAENCYLSDGLVPGQDNIVEAAKQISTAIDIKADLKRIAADEITNIEETVRKLNEYQNDISSAINDIQYKINCYNSSVK